MNFIRRYACILLTALVSCIPIVCSPKLLIIDTDGHQKYYNRTLIHLAESVGYTVTYHSFYETLENNVIQEFDAVFFLIGYSFLKNLSHPLAQDVLTSVKRISEGDNKIIGIFLPSTNQFVPALFSTSIDLLHTLNVFNPDNEDKENNSLFITHSFLKHLLQSDALHGFLYGTSLINIKNVNFPPITNQHGNSYTQLLDLHDNTVIARTLPHHAALPKGLYLKNTVHNSHFLITKISEFNFADINENFFRTPLHCEHRERELRKAQQTLWEFFKLCDKTTTDQGQPSPPLPNIFTCQHVLRNKEQAEKQLNSALAHNQHYAWIAQEGISCAWEAYTDYFLAEETTLQSEEKTNIDALKEKALARGITFLYDAQINLVWFEFNPETFFSSQGRYKEKKSEFIEQVHHIAQAFKEIYKEKPLPKIFVGTDITTNFGVMSPKNHAVDVFGTNYTRIPSPLDLTHFWKPELLDVFDAYCKALSSVLPIDGIFLDFEMYHAQDQASSYTELMDFSDVSWNIYHAKKAAVPVLSNVKERVNYLKDKALFSDYFLCLEHAANDLGCAIKNHLRKLVPNVIIAAYAPTLVSSWFYRGIMAGLSSAQEPLIFASFNSDVYSHYSWLVEHNIHIIHGAPILLSKFDSAESFSLISQLLKHHYFVWFNRPSRMIYKEKTNRWWSAEASPLEAHTVSRGIKNTTKKQTRTKP